MLPYIWDSAEKVVSTSAAVMSNGLTIFTVSGGPVAVCGLMSVCATDNGATASTVQYTHDPTAGAATTISAASASLANAAAGASLSLQGTALSTAPTLTANGACLAQTREIILQPGTIALVVAVGSTTGTWAHHLRFRPLAAGAAVTIAF